MHCRTSLPSTCLIIPVHNGGALFRQCLRSVADMDPQPDEITVVDDGSSDGSGQLAEAAGYRVIRRNSPGGPALARNAGAAQTTADILVFLDADTSAPKNFIGQAVRLLEGPSGVGAVIGSYDDSPAHPGFFSQYRNLLHHYTHQTSSEHAVTFWGACGAMRRESFFAFGGFDESLYYLEDVELGLRLSRGGQGILLAKQWQIKHWKKYTAWTVIKTDFMHRALPWTRLALVGYGLINDLNTRFSNRISVVLSLLIPWFAAAGFFTAWGWLGLLMCLCLLVLINRGFYIFLAQRKKIGFAIRAVFWHWLHYLVSGLGFIAGFLEYYLKITRKRMARFRPKQTY